MARGSPSDLLLQFVMENGAGDCCDASGKAGACPLAPEGVCCLCELGCVGAWFTCCLIIT